MRDGSSKKRIYIHDLTCKDGILRRERKGDEDGKGSRSREKDELA